LSSGLSRRDHLIAKKLDRGLDNANDLGSPLAELLAESKRGDQLLVSRRSDPPSRGRSLIAPCLQEFFVCSRR